MNIANTQAENNNVKLINKILAYPEIESDEDILDTILRNLISNAIKLTYSGGQIAVNALKIKDKIHISVAETGIGMSNQETKKLFQMDKNIQSRKGTAREKGSGFMQRVRR